MKPNEVEALFMFASYLQPAITRGKTKDEKNAMATAWAWALDVRITLDQGRRIVTDLVAEKQWVDPGSINERFLIALRKPNEPLGRPKLPAGHAEDVIKPEPRLALEAKTIPALPQDVPEYANKNNVIERLTNQSVPCPYCEAKVGRPCTSTQGPMRGWHPSRLEQARKGRGAGVGGDETPF